MTKKMNLLMKFSDSGDNDVADDEPAYIDKSGGEYNEIDRLFESTITEIFDYEQTEGGGRKWKREGVARDINLCELGVLCDFAYKDKEGFAIIDDGDVKVTEIYAEGKIRIQRKRENVCNEGMYWYSDRGNYESETGTEMRKKRWKRSIGSAYKGVEKLQYDTERIGLSIDRNAV
ncbi:MAG: hypothetical protein ACLRSW_11165 [Christensenellaceae bacterium]